MTEQSAEERAYKSIIRLIISQRYPPGTPLIEDQIAKEIGMSRTPVRNALRRLISDGFLDNPYNKSASVPCLSRMDLEKLFNTRLHIEPRAAYEAALNAKEDQMGHFDQLIARERDAYFKGSKHLYELNEQIHFGIASLAENIYIQGAIKPLFWRSELYTCFFDSFYVSNEQKTLLRDPDKSVSHLEHKALIEAVFCNKPDEAQEIMRTHILSTKKMLTNNAGFYPNS